MQILEGVEREGKEVKVVSVHDPQIEKRNEKLAGYLTLRLMKRVHSHATPCSLLMVLERIANAHGVPVTIVVVAIDVTVLLLVQSTGWTTRAPLSQDV